LRRVCGFEIVVAYEEIAAGKRAKEICDRLQTNLEAFFVFETHLWRFDVLGLPELNNIAVRDAIQARLVIIAIDGRSELPVHLKSWMEIWVALRPVQPGALVLVVEPPPGCGVIQCHSERHYLERIAQRARMRFFASIPGSQITPQMVTSR
jgi:hypothetical protein